MRAQLILLAAAATLLPVSSVRGQAADSTEMILSKLDSVQSQLNQLARIVGALDTTVSTVDATVGAVDSVVARLDSVLAVVHNEVITTEAPVIGWTHRLCFKVPVDLTLNLRAKLEAQAQVRGSLGAWVFGDGAWFGADAKGKNELFGALKGGGAMDLSWCGPQVPLSTAAATGSLPALIMSAADSLGMTEANAAKLLALITGFESDLTDPIKLLGAGDTPITGLVTAAPLPAAVRSSIPTGAAFVTAIVDDVKAICTDTLPPVVRTVVDEFCHPPSPLPSTVLTEMEGLVTRIDSVVQSIPGDIRQISQTVNQLDAVVTDTLITAFDDFCSDVNAFLQNLNAMSVGWSGSSIDFGQWNVATGASLDLSYISILDFDVVDGASVNVSRSSIGPGTKTIGAFSVQPFTGLPKTVCRTIQ